MISKDYYYSEIYSDAEGVQLPLGSALLYSCSEEHRSGLKDILSGVDFSNIPNIQLGIDALGEYVISPDNERLFSLRSSDQILNFLQTFSNCNCLLLDISDFDTKLCAALFKVILSERKNLPPVRTVYIEPEYYEIKKFSSHGVYFDMAEEIEGISPLPGFEHITPDDEDSVFLIPFLGFEGGRFAHVLESVPVSNKKNIIPVIGLPGFRAEYPFVSLRSNETSLMQSDSWTRIKYATANSIIDALIRLEDIYRTHQSATLKVAPIGTKPHTVASIIFAAMHPTATELIYDHPLHRTQKTRGVGRIVITDISKFIGDTYGA